jgi:RNA-directed DNA polymerase
MRTETQLELAAVMRQSASKQAREALDPKWSWVEPSVWSKRMVRALEHGVKGGRWFSLIDKVHASENLRAAFRQVNANKGKPGVDYVTVAEYGKRIGRNLEELGRALREGTYRPQKIRRTYIPKPGSPEKRPLGIPTVRDRTAETALKHVIEPIFEVGFADNSYGFRPGRGCKHALERVEGLIRDGYHYVIDADLKSYFDSIPHAPLLDRIRERIADGRILSLIESYLKQGILEGMEEWTPEEGSPQGAVISPLLANVYLNPLDHLMQRKGYEMIRYADDFVVLCRTEQEAVEALEEVRRWTEEAELTLHPGKTRIVNMAQPDTDFEFLGYRFRRTRRGRLGRWPREKSLKKLRETIRRRTRRRNPCSLEETITQLNPVLRGWFNYFQQSAPSAFEETDSWIRMRLRTILRHRRGGRGRSYGLDHNRWPNAFFAEHGLFSLTAARSALPLIPPWR